MTVKIRRSAQGQAMPRETVALPSDAFGPSDATTVYWLGNAGFLINSRGTTIMCDPLLVGFDMPVLVDPPVLPEDVPHVDALLYTHIDNDHFNRICLAALANKYDELHATEYVASVARDEEGIPGAIGHDIGETFKVGPLSITLTPTWHNWQDHGGPGSKYGHRRWERKEYCGYWIETPDGSIWNKIVKYMLCAVIPIFTILIRLCRQRWAHRLCRCGGAGKPIPRLRPAAHPLGLRRRTQLHALQR